MPADVHSGGSHWPRTDRPRTNSDSREIARKTSLLHDKHVAPLTAYVDRLRQAYPHDPPIPYFDPTEAGTTARIALLLEAPGGRSALGSGFVSADNDDPTANNMWDLLRDVGCDRAREIVTWNAVPYYVSSGKVTTADVERARPATQEFLELLPDLRVVVLLGRVAQGAWGRLGLDVPAIECWNPSPLALNRLPQRRDEVRDAMRRARTTAGYVT